MISKYVIVDANAIINIFAGAGSAGWDQLLNIQGDTEIVILKSTVQEIASNATNPDFPIGLRGVSDGFGRWLDGNCRNGVTLVNGGFCGSSLFASIHLNCQPPTGPARH